MLLYSEISETLNYQTSLTEENIYEYDKTIQHIHTTPHITTEHQNTIHKHRYRNLKKTFKTPML